MIRMEEWHNHQVKWQWNTFVLEEFQSNRLNFLSDCIWQRTNLNANRDELWMEVNKWKNWEKGNSLRRNWDLTMKMWCSFQLLHQTTISQLFQSMELIELSISQHERKEYVYWSFPIENWRNSMPNIQWNWEIEKCLSEGRNLLENQQFQRNECIDTTFPVHTNVWNEWANDHMKIVQFVHYSEPSSNFYCPIWLVRMFGIIGDFHWMEWQKSCLKNT